MEVKRKYSYISESLLYEEVVKGSRMQGYYTFWQSIKDIDSTELKGSDYIKLQKIIDLHMRLLKKRA